MKIAGLFKNMTISLYESIKRFPAALLLSAVCAVLLIYISEIQYTISSPELTDILSRITMTLALGIPLSLCIRLILERMGEESAYKPFIYYGAGSAALVLYYLLLLPSLDMVSVTGYIGASIILYLAFLFIPFIKKREGYELYITRILTVFFTTVLYSIVLFLGLAAILFTIDKLLAVAVDSKIYYYTWLLVVFLFAPSYFLAGVPRRDCQNKEGGYPKLLKILLMYIVMPLLSVYTIILYIYFVKIIVTWQWPVGLVSHLVLWYSVITEAVLLFITPMGDKSKWAGKFLLWMPRVIIPILIMMFVSMGIRINAYGVTESRYFVLALGLWVVIVFIYRSVKVKVNSTIIHLLLSIMVLVSVFGPVSSYSVSIWSQNNRFNSILEKNNMLTGGAIHPSPNQVSREDKEEVSRIIDYFKYNHSLKDIKFLPEGFDEGDMDKVFGFAYESPRYGLMEEYYYFTSDSMQKAVDVRDYDYMFDTRSLYNKYENSTDIIDALYTPESSKLNIRHAGSVVYDEYLNKFVSGLIDKYGAISKGGTIPYDDMTFIEENEKVRVKLIFASISAGRDIQGGGFKVNGLDFYVLVKIK